MYSQGQSPTPPLRILSLVAIAALIIAVAIPVLAQNSVPPTAVQAAKMPQYASRLAHPAKRVTPPKSQVFARATKHRGPLDSNDIYDNGPINGNTDAWTINFGYITSDSFNIAASNQTAITGMSFGAWLFAGDTLTSVEVSITSGENSGTSYFDQTVNFTQGDCMTNQYGYNVCTETTSFNGPTLNAGTYWVNLQNATVPSGDPVYWDENSGLSQASQNDVGSIPSEAFTILGEASSTGTYECVHDKPEDGFKVIHTFSNNLNFAQDHVYALAIDRAGKLYGTTWLEGGYGLGMAYSLAQAGLDWTFTSLYSFAGGAGGQNPLPGTLGPDGALYSTASGGRYGFGVVYRLGPSPTACLNAPCSWTETVLHAFTGEPDGSAPTQSLIFDELGNLYGTTSQGGAHGQGTIYELTPHYGSWTEKVIYSFTGGSDGGSPVSLLLGQDGNLYGTTSRGGDGGGGGVIFRLAPSGDSWTEIVIASYGDCGGYCWVSPAIIQERSGHFYGIYSYGVETCDPYECDWATYGRIFVMSPSGGGWQFTILDDTWNYFGGQGLGGDGAYAVFYDLAIDTAEQLYATEGERYYGYCDEELCAAEKVFELLQPNQEQNLVGFNGNNFRDVELGAGGRLYGTTGWDGDANCPSQAVWELTPQR